MEIESFLDEKVKNKRVFEIGGFGSFENYSKRNFQNWRYAKIKKIAKALYGGDINSRGVEFVKSCGFDYFYFDIEKTDISQELGYIDTILLLDVVEHLNNVGMALENIKKYMSDNTEFIITTPNPMSLNNIIRTLFFKGLNTLEDHTMWLDICNVRQLAARYGFEVIYVDYFTFNPESNFKQMIINFAGKINKYFHQNFIVILKKIK